MLQQTPSINPPVGLLLATPPPTAYWSTISPPPLPAVPSDRRIPPSHPTTRLTELRHVSSRYSAASSSPASGPPSSSSTFCLNPGAADAQAGAAAAAAGSAAAAAARRGARGFAGILRMDSACSRITWAHTAGVSKCEQQTRTCCGQNGSCYNPTAAVGVTAQAPLPAAAVGMVA
jgi:hypothetical protein